MADQGEPDIDWGGSIAEINDELVEYWFANNHTTGDPDRDVDTAQLWAERIIAENY